MPKEVQQSKEDETKDRTIFLSGLSYETTDETLHEYFDVYGEIEYFSSLKPIGNLIYQSTKILRIT